VRKTGTTSLNTIKSGRSKPRDLANFSKRLGEGKEGVAMTVTSTSLHECLDGRRNTFRLVQKEEICIWQTSIKGRESKRRNRDGSADAGVRPFPEMICFSVYEMNDDGSFNLLVGATDLGTGSDTVLA